MRHAYRTGLGVALSQWRLVLVVFLVGLIGGMTFVGCAWIALAGVLDASLATRTLLTKVDMNVIVDVLAHHGRTLRLLGGTALALAVGWSCFWIWMNASVVAAVSGDRRALRSTFSIGAEKFWPFARLWLFAMSGHAVAAVGAYIAWRVLGQWAADSSNEMTAYWILTGCVAAAVLAGITVMTVHDHARVRCVETGDGAGRCMMWACGYVVRERRTLLLSGLLIATVGAAWVPYQAVSELIPVTSALGLTASFLWAETFMVFRALMRVWSFAAVACLQAHAEEG